MVIAVDDFIDGKCRVETSDFTLRPDAPPTPLSRVEMMLVAAGSGQPGRRPKTPSDFERFEATVAGMISKYQETL